MFIYIKKKNHKNSAKNRLLAYSIDQNQELSICLWVLSFTSKNQKKQTWILTTHVCIFFIWSVLLSRAR